LRAFGRHLIKPLRHPGSMSRSPWVHWEAPLRVMEALYGQNTESRFARGLARQCKDTWTPALIFVFRILTMFPQPDFLTGVGRL
jgi:hypothetical protein